MLCHGFTQFCTAFRIIKAAENVVGIEAPKKIMDDYIRTVVCQQNITVLMLRCEVERLHAH